MSKKYRSFGSGGEPIPNKVERFKEPQEVAHKLHQKVFMKMRIYNQNSLNQRDTEY